MDDSNSELHRASAAEVAPEVIQQEQLSHSGTSQRKIAANQRNGARGGVKTEAGKHRSRRNALRHGMRATTLLVEDEINPAFRTLREALEQEYEPRTTTEHMLMEKMVLERVSKIPPQRNPEASEVKECIVDGE